MTLIRLLEKKQAGLCLCKSHGTVRFSRDDAKYEKYLDGMIKMVLNQVHARLVGVNTFSLSNTSFYQ